MKIQFTEPQARFITSEATFPAMIAGYGAGKSEGAIWRTLRLKRENPKTPVAYYLPTYGLITDIAIPRFEEKFASLHIPYSLNKVDNFFEIEGYGKIVMRSMDRPEKIIGYEVGHSLVDELDTLTIDKARDVWGKIVSRNRAKVKGKNTIGVATTPEGFRFVYEKWKRHPMKGSELIKASTYSNPFLPEDYIDNLKETISENLLEAYINGEFVNMTNASVYDGFDRVKNNTAETHSETEPLHVGMDFNVGQMSAVVHVLRNNEPHAVLEYTGILDTPAMIIHLKNRHPNNPILVYPDASGNSRKSVNASESDLSLLRQAGFNVLVNGRNPRVKDRVMSMNAMFKSGAYRVNADLCPNYVESLEKQAYDKNGEPDKTSGFDHLCFSGETLVKTPQGIKKIKDIPKNGYIIGHNGNYVRYKNAGITGIDKRTVRVILSSGEEIECTPNHKFLTDNGKWIEAKDLKSQKLVTLNKSITASCITSAACIFKGMAFDFIEKFIKIVTEKYQAAGLGIFTILMAIHRITILKILNCSHIKTILKNTYPQELKDQKNSGIAGMGERCLNEPPNGMVAKKVKSGIKRICQKIALYSTKSASTERAIVAERIIKHLSTSQGFVLKNARQSTEGKAALTILRNPATGAVKSLWRTNTQKERYATSLVREVKESKRQSVYCITVPKYSCFSLKNGAIVSNCDSGGYFISYRYPIVKDEIIKFKLQGL